MVRQTWRAVGGILVAAACVLPALAVAKSVASGSASHLAAHHAGRAGGLLRLAMPDASPAIDPALVADEEDVELAGLLYSGLVRLDASYRVVPDSAASWRVEADHRTYVFHLRHGLRFRNGDPVTAQDFAFSINRSLNPSLKSPSAATYLSDIEGAQAVQDGKAKAARGIRVLDPYTLQITARWPVPYFLLELSYPTSFALDARQLSKPGAADDFSWYTNPNGSGPYRVKSWSPNNEMVLVPNQHYLGLHPALKEIRVVFSPLATSHIYQSVNRTLDVAPLCTREHGLIRKPGIQETTMLAVDGIYMNMKRKPFSSSGVRRALQLALDRSAVVRTMGGTVTPFAGFVLPGESGYDPALRSLSYSRTAALAALAAAGYPKGTHFPATTLYYGDDPCAPSVGKLALQIAKAWHKYLHLKIDTRALNPTALLAKEQSGGLGLYLGGWVADYPDPHDTLAEQWESTALNNDVHFRSSRFDALARTADVTWDPRRRAQLYAAAQQVLADDVAWIPLYIPHRLVFIRPTVDNLAVTGYGLIPRNGSWAGVGVQSSAPKSSGLRSR